jgi:hypothetical protein
MDKKENKILKEWKKWKALHSYTTFEVILVSENIDNKAFFVIKSPKEVDYQFVLGVEANMLTGLFEADYSNRCLDEAYCFWISIMDEEISTNYEKGLSYILTKAVEMYKNVIKMKESGDIGYIINSEGFESGLSKTLKEIYNSNNKNIKIMPITNKNYWRIEIRGKNTLIKAFAVINDFALGLYANLRVLSPRLQLGGNVNFGGCVRYKGLTDSSKVKTIKELIDNIYDSLKDENVDEAHEDPYNDDEYNSSKILPSVTINISNVEKLSVNIDTNISADKVIMNLRYINKYLKGQDPYLFAVLTSKLGISSWYVVIPSNNVNYGKIKISPLACAFLGVEEDDILTVHFGKPPMASQIRVRSRDDTISNSTLRDSLATFKCLTTGHTYKAEDKYSPTGDGFFFDVFSAGELGACRLIADPSEKEKTYDIVVATVDSLKTKEIDYLAINYSQYSHDTEESSDDEDDEYYDEL